MQLSWLLRGIRTGVLTTRYPSAKESMPDRWRGVVELDLERCRVEASASPCVASCPSAALRLEGSGVATEPERLVFDPLACVACGRCVEVCPAGALRMTARFELARLDHPRGSVVG